MSNIRQIQPVTMWTPTGQKTATLFALVNFFDYHFDGGNGKVTYKLIGMEAGQSTTLQDGTVVAGTESAVDYFTDNLIIPAEVMQEWTGSDDMMFDYVTTTLGLVLVGSTPTAKKWWEFWK